MSNLNDPKYRAAVEANDKLMRDSGEPQKRSPGMSVLDEMAQQSGFSTIEEMLKACENAKPVDEYQQQVLNAMKNQVTNIILLFGPGHGHTMQLNGPPADEIMWQGPTDAEIVFAQNPDPMEHLRAAKRNIHRYRLNDEMESAQMEEVAIYTHHEKCCDTRMPTTGHTSRPDRYKDMRFRGY
jgi:hypothetical protein